MIPTWLKPLAAGVAATLCLILGVVVAGRVASGALDAAGTAASAPGQVRDPAERLRLAPPAVTAASGGSGGGGLAAPALATGGVLGAGPDVAAATPAGVAPAAAIVPPALVPSPSPSPSSPRRTSRLIRGDRENPQRPAPAPGATAPDGAAAVSGALPVAAAVAARLRIRVADADVNNQLGDGVLRLRMAISQESGTAVALPGDLDLRLAVDPQTVAAARERAADGPVALAARIDVHRPDAGEGAPELRVQLRVVTGTAAPEETAVKPCADDPAALSNAIEVVVPLPEDGDARRPGDGGPGGAPPAAAPPDAGAPPGALTAAVIQISLPLGPATATVGTSGVGVPVVTSAGSAPDLEVAVTLGPSVDAPAGAPTPTTPAGGDGASGGGGPSAGDGAGDGDGDGPSDGAGDGAGRGDGSSDGDGAGDGAGKDDGWSKGDGASKGDGSSNGDDGDWASDEPGESGEPEEDAPTAQPMTATPPASPSTAVPTTATGTSPAAAEPQPVGTTPAGSGPVGTAPASTAPEVAGSAPEAGVTSTPSGAGTAPGDGAPDDDDC